MKKPWDTSVMREGKPSGVTNHGSRITLYLVFLTIFSAVTRRGSSLGGRRSSSEDFFFIRPVVISSMVCLRPRSIGMIHILSGHCVTLLYPERGRLNLVDYVLEVGDEFVRILGAEDVPAIV